MERRLGMVARCAAVGLAALALAAILACALLPDLASTGRELDSAPFDQVLVWIAEAALLGSGCWLCLLAVLVSARAAAGAATTCGVPRWWRRAVLAGCGVALVGSVAAPAHADSGRPLPDRATAATHVSNLVSIAASRPSRPTVLSAWVAVSVRPGDSLWAIAQDALPPGSRVARVAALTHRIHVANASTIGDDPDLIFPGQRLWVLPPRPVREESS